MRMVTAGRTGMLALLVAVPAAAQAPRQDADAAARAFIDALNQHRWADAADMVLPATAEWYRRQELARFVAVTEHYARGERIVMLSSLPDSADPTRLAALASTRLFRFPGGETLGDAARLSPRSFMASSLENRFSIPEAPDIEPMWPRYIGVVVENDSLAHALYRITGAEVRCDDSVTRLLLRRVDGRWYVAPDWASLGSLTSQAEITGMR